MKLFSPIVIFFVFLMWFVIACKKDETTKETDLYGKWEWFSSKSRLHGTIITPQTEGYTQSLEFKTSGKIEFFKNDSVTAEKAFSIVHDASISTLPIIKLENDLLWMYSFVADTLYLENICPNCFDDKYVKVK